jgi:hypothetical protein
MEVRVPEPAHVRDFITTDLARLPSHRPRWVVGRSRGALPLAQQPLRQHVAPHRRVRRQRYQRRVGVDEDAQIVDVQLVAPAAVRLVLRAQRVARTARPWWLLLGILPHPRSQAAHRIDGALARGSTSARGSSGRRSRTGRCHTRPASVVECHLELALLGDPRAPMTAKRKCAHQPCRRPAPLSLAIPCLPPGASGSGFPPRWGDQTALAGPARRIVWGARPNLAERARRRRRRPPEEEEPHHLRDGLPVEPLEQAARDREPRPVARSENRAACQKWCARSRLATNSGSESASARSRLGARAGTSPAKAAGPAAAHAPAARPRRRTRGRGSHAAQDLLKRYAEAHVGLERLAVVAAARGDRSRAAEYRRKAADFVHAHADLYRPEMEVWLRKRAAEFSASP